MGDDPPYLQVGTEVSAKYKGAFCEAKIRKVVRVVKCKVTFKAGLGSANLSDDNIKGELRAGNVVEAKHQDKNQFMEATINKIQDCSQYTVVFDDGDITTLRRSALCLKSGRHFNESETLDQLPLTHPEHFSNPVVGGRRGVRRRAANNDDNDNESSEDEDTSPTKKGQKKTNKEADMGKVVCVESTDKKKSKDNWFPALIVSPSAQETVKIRTKDEYLVRSFRDGRYYTVPKKEITDFTKDSANKSEHSTSFLRGACEKAVQYLEKNVLPPHWDRDILFGHSNASNSDEVPSDSESEDDQRENKDRFVAQLFKFMDERGTPINKVPTVCGKDLDLYKLYKVVTSRGGYNKVTNSSQWKPVTMKMGYGQMPTTSTINLVKQAYKKFLHNFEEFYRKLGCSLTSLNSRPPSTQAGKSRSNRSIFRERERHASSSAKKEEPKVEKDKDDDEKDKKSTTSAASGTASATPSEIDGETESLIDGESAADEPRRSRSRLESRGKKEFDELSEKADKPSPSGKGKRGSKKKDTANTSTPSVSELKEREIEREEAQTPVSASPSPAPSSTGGKRGRGKYKKRDKPPEAEEEEARVEPEESHDHIGKNVKIELGDKLQVYYGPKSKGNVTYEAKVIDIKEAGGKFLVHYTGWNTRYDEWIDRYRIASSCNQKDAPDFESVRTSSPSGSITKTTPKVPKKKGRPASIGTGGPPQNPSGPPKGKVGARKRLTSESEKTKGRRSRKKSGQESFTQSGSESDQDQNAEDSSDSEEKQRLISTPPSSVGSSASSARASTKATPGRKRKIRLEIPPEVEDDDASSASSSTTESSTGKSSKADSGPPDGGSNNQENNGAPVVVPGYTGPPSTSSENQNQVIDLNKIRSEMKGLDKMVKVSATATVAATSQQSSASSISSSNVSTPPTESSSSTSTSNSAPSFAATLSQLPQVTVSTATTPTTVVPSTAPQSSHPPSSVGVDVKLDVYEFQDDGNEAPKLKVFAPRSPDKKEEPFCLKTGAHADVEKSMVKTGEDPARHQGSGTGTGLVSTAIPSTLIVVPNPTVNPAMNVPTESSAVVKSSSPTVLGKEDLGKSTKEVKKDIKEKPRKEKEVKENSKLQPPLVSDTPVSTTPKGRKHSLTPITPTPSLSSSPVSVFDRLSAPAKGGTQIIANKVQASSGVPVMQATPIIETKSSLKIQNPVLHTPQQPARQRAVISSYPPPLIPSGAPKVLPVQIQPRSSTLSPPMPSLTLRPAIPSLAANPSPNSTSVIAGLPLVTPQLHPQLQHFRPVAPPTSAIINIPSVVSTEQPPTIPISFSSHSVSTAPSLPLPPTPVLHPAITITASGSTVSPSVLHKPVDSKASTAFGNRQQELFQHLAQPPIQQQPQSILNKPIHVPLQLPKFTSVAPVSVITPNQNPGILNVNKELGKNPNSNFSPSQHSVLPPVSVGGVSTSSSLPFTVHPVISPRKSPVKRKQPSKEKNRNLNPAVTVSSTPTASVVLSLGVNVPPKKKPRKVITKNIIDIQKSEVESGGGHSQVHGHISLSVPSTGLAKDEHNSGADSPTKKARKPAKKRIKIDSEMALVSASGGTGNVGDKLSKPVKTPKKRVNKIDIPAPPTLLPSKSLAKNPNTLRYLPPTVTSSSALGFGIGNPNSLSFVSTAATSSNIMGSQDKSVGSTSTMVLQDSVIKSAVYIKPPELQSLSSHGKPMVIKGGAMSNVSGSVLGVLKTPDKKSYSPKMSAATAARIASCIDTVAKLPPEAQVQAKSVLTIQPAKGSPTSLSMSTAPAPGGHTTTTTFVKIPGKFEPEPIVITTVTTAPPASQSVASKPVTVIPAMVQKAVSGVSTVQTTINIPNLKGTEVAAKSVKASPPVLTTTTLPTSLILSQHGCGSDIGGRNIKPVMVVPIPSNSTDSNITIPQTTNLPVILKTEIKEETKPKGHSTGGDVQNPPSTVPIPLLFVKKNPVTVQDPPGSGSASSSSVHGLPSNKSKISNSPSTTTSVLSIKVSGGGGVEVDSKVLKDEPSQNSIPVVSIKEAGPGAGGSTTMMDVVDIVKSESGTTSGTKDEDESCHSLLCEEEIPGSPPPGADSSLFGVDDENARLSISSPKESPKLPSTNNTNSPAGTSKIQTQYKSGSGNSSSGSVVSSGLHPVDKGAENSDNKTAEFLFGISTSSSKQPGSSSAAPSSADNLALLQKHRDVGKAAQSLLSLADRPSANSSGHGHNQIQNQVPIQQPPIAFPNVHNQNLQNVIDNTPPTTPESSSISSGSPRVEGGRVSPTHDHQSSSKSNSKDSSDVDSADQKISEITEEGSSSDAGRKSLKGVSSSPQKKRHVEAIRTSRNDSPPAKRRRVQRRKSPDEVIRSYGYRGRGSGGGRKSNSDKDHDHGRILPPPPPINLTKPPMSRKFNLIPDLDDEMESETRIQVLQVALQSIKEKYQEVKSELSSEERRLKRFKRRQKEREKEKSRSCQKTT